MGATAVIGGEHLGVALRQVEGLKRRPPTEVGGLGLEFRGLGFRVWGLGFRLAPKTRHGKLKITLWPIWFRVSETH